MELIIWNKGVQGIKYLCDECSETVNERDGLWVTGPEDKQICFTCFKYETKKKKKQRTIVWFLLSCNGCSVLT